MAVVFYGSIISFSDLPSLGWWGRKEKNKGGKLTLSYLLLIEPLINVLSLRQVSQCWGPDDVMAEFSPTAWEISHCTIPLLFSLFYSHCLLLEVCVPEVFFLIWWFWQHGNMVIFLGSWGIQTSFGEVSILRGVPICIIQPCSKSYVCLSTLTCGMNWQNCKVSRNEILALPFFQAW